MQLDAWRGRRHRRNDERAARARRSSTRSMTLAQLPERERRSRWVLPCVDIRDLPAMRWRIVSDDVSRGPFPTMRYAKERIRTLASLKINGWSPYMEQVFADPRHPFVAWPNGWTAAQLRELAAYARRFHVTLIPEQQTFAHMHETLKWEQLAPLAELPHGYLLAESDPGTYAYLEPLVRGVLAATKPAPFFHLGADEPIDLGARAHAAHAASVRGSREARRRVRGGQRRAADDLGRRDPAGPVDHAACCRKRHRRRHVPLRRRERRSSRTSRRSDRGLRAAVAPGAANWNEIYPDLTTAYANVARIRRREGRRARATCSACS